VSDRLDALAAQSGFRQKIDGVKGVLLRLSHWNGSIPDSSFWRSAANPA
jgi:hypothetical protein